MFTNITVHRVALFLMLIGAFLSGVVTWLYFKKAVSPRGRHLTRWQKYVPPAIILAVTNLITVTGFYLLLVHQNETIQTYDDWVTIFMNSIACFGCFFMFFLFVYIVNVRFYGPPLQSKKDNQQ